MFPATSQSDVFTPVHRLTWLNPEGGVDWEDVPSYISVRRLHPGPQTDVVKPRGRGGLGGCSQLHLSQTSSSRTTDCHDQQFVSGAANVAVWLSHHVSIALALSQASTEHFPLKLAPGESVCFTVINIE